MVSMLVFEGKKLITLKIVSLLKLIDTCMIFLIFADFFNFVKEVLTKPSLVASKIFCIFEVNVVLNC